MHGGDSLGILRAREPDDDLRAIAQIFDPAESTGPLGRGRDGLDQPQEGGGACPLDRDKGRALATQHDVMVGRPLQAHDITGGISALGGRLDRP